jgi:hypothetical protein
MPLVSFTKFIPRYFIVFEAIVIGIISLISFSVCALLVYRKTTDFCMLILYPAHFTFVYFLFLMHIIPFKFMGQNVMSLSMYALCNDQIKLITYLSLYLTFLCGDDI